MENSFSDSDQEHSDTDTKCSVLLYVTPDGTVMFDASWNDKTDREANMMSLSQLIHAMTATDLLENALKNSIKALEEANNAEYLEDMNTIFENYQQIKSSNIMKKENPDAKDSPAIRPLQAK